MEPFSPKRGRHLYTVNTSSTNTGRMRLGVELMMAMYRARGNAPRDLVLDAQAAGDYALEPPVLMPAGSMVFDKFGEAKDDWLPMPSTVQR